MDPSPYLVLLRGINVGGRNKVPMKALKGHLEDLGYEQVSTYIASGNVLLTSADTPEVLGPRIEAALIDNFALDDELIKVLVLSPGQLRAVVEQKPEGFGEQPTRYHSDAIFLMGIDAGEAMTAFNPREGVDAVWPGDGVIYSQRLSAERTKSRLSAITASPFYKSMTIRSWNTTTKLRGMLPE
ncbi:DUF1697 domain-containing protein [Arthrobacter sp. zg-Y820]|uniref:DUF1697 domain-containing protein n=1 Tax=unclassified Arthrobacter TaxID=235627 RepID=UPI00254069DB|nr:MULTISPECIES: DUF1697 domain-containing protein [unclassified Arthrobacter]MCC9196352.1 DUF1697 domain-containing protein [Arthrobacter sp. zg-Y820]MDK1279213.1 DUF1697 domain-containing protein [Arthrobacter sp. zg.Y820]MDK1359170.1 DUF1697 domain-containing protein [Arthrobacter sp. zg-Y1219]WIB08389.1 DUF1697 domain-containing protein [Arthrobacter sp. zg-Y820]